MGVAERAASGTVGRANVGLCTASSLKTKTIQTSSASNYTINKRELPTATVTV